MLSLVFVHCMLLGIHDRPTGVDAVGRHDRGDFPRKETVLMHLSRAYVRCCEDLMRGI